MKNLKKLAVILMSMLLVVALFGCGKTEEPAPEAEAPAEEAPVEEAPVEEAPAEEAAKEESAVMSYEEFMAAELGERVTVETYVQAHQSWWEGACTLYTQNEEGAYFAYKAQCDEETAEKLVPGTKVRLTGDKADFNGEVEITDAVIEIIEGETYIAEPTDLTELFGKDELVEHQNVLAAFKGLTVADKGDGKAFMYNWDGSGAEGDDLYFDVTLGQEQFLQFLLHEADESGALPKLLL